MTEMSHMSSNKESQLITSSIDR